MHVCMVAFSDLHFDYRIYREATSLHNAGHQVTIVAAAKYGGPRLCGSLVKHGIRAKRGWKPPSPNRI